MIIRFNNTYLENLAEDLHLKGKPKYDTHVISKFKRVLTILGNAESTVELRNYHGLNFEALKGDRKGYYSLRVDYYYRLIISIEKDVITIDEIVIIEDLTNHYR